MNRQAASETSTSNNYANEIYTIVFEGGIKFR
jgi:hypothetical protein